MIANSWKQVKYQKPPVRTRSMRAAAPACAWTPLPGPQALAYQSVARWIGYGGAAGGGKTDLGLGLAGTRHRRSLIMRRLFPSLRGAVERSREVYNPPQETASTDRYNESLHRWRLRDRRMVEFGNVQFDADWQKYRGNPFDLHVFDEATEFSEQVVRSITAWNRTSVPGQACRVLLTFNPPSDETGRWVIRFFLPWMAYLYPDLPECKAYTGTPAQPGELRWFTTIDGADVEVPEGTPKAQSRTFFPARVEDNPVYMASGYDATLEALPEPLRSQLRYGSFLAGIKADPWQVIPTDWVDAAMARWTAARPRVKLGGVGLDVARGGDDQTVVARRYGQWYAELAVAEGSETPTGGMAAAFLLSTVGDELAHEPTIGVDVIGIGASAYDQLEDVQCEAVNVGAGAPDGATDSSGKLTFVNMRAYLWWQLREALNPETGDDLMLPPDPQLRAELTAPRWTLRSGRILVESKDDLRKRLSRSTNRADALMLASLPESGGVRWL